MTAITPNLAANAMGRADARDSEAASAADSGPFVLNLCSSTTPMALAQTDLAELKRFTFFVSRRFEEGRERFRLHMGYFTTLAEAEEWLNVVREIYPGAWAGEAPGKKLRARAAAAAEAQAQHALGPQPRSALPNLPSGAAPSAAASHPAPSVRAAAPAQARPTHQNATAHAAAPVARPADPKPTAPRTPVASQGPFESAGIHVPTVHAAVPASAPPTVSPPVLAPPVAKAAPVHAMAPIAKAAPAHVGVPVAKAATGAPVPTTRPLAAGVQARPGAVAAPINASKAAPVAGGIHAPPRVEAPRAPAPTAAAPARPPVKIAVAPVASNTSRRPGGKPSKGNAFADSNVREVLAALGDTSETGQTRMMPALPRVEVAEDPSLTDTQVLRYLETRREDGRTAEDAPDASISLLKPDDTGTRRALKDAVTQNAPVSFAVQLQWAVQPVELDKVPPLAIFSAYTLYTVEGSREGRKWYGLRLGFFSDAISAKQVAYYVRSEFASVAVVPVSPQEKDRASEEDNKKANAAMAFPRKTRSGPVDEFKLIDSDDQKDAGSGASAAGKPGGTRPAAAKPAPTAAVRSAPQPPAIAKRAPTRGSGGRVGARERRGPQTLEETLEILGAGELEVDNGRGETLNDTGVRHLRVEIQKNTPFSRLLERLSERTKKN
jgi:hypothetical protein